MFRIIFAVLRYLQFLYLLTNLHVSFTEITQLRKRSSAGEFFKIIQIKLELIQIQTRLLKLFENVFLVIQFLF